MRIIEFKAGHVDLIEHRTMFDDHLEYMMGRIESVAHSDLVQARTLVYNGTVVAILGIVHQWPGVAQIWTITSDHIVKIPIAFQKATWTLLRYAEVTWNLHRIEAHVKADYEQGIRWAKSFGFQYEGYMHKYCLNQHDWLLFARVK